MDTIKPTPLIVACRNFFGYKSGQNLVGFKEEFNALTSEDKDYFKLGFQGAGFNIA